MIHPSTELKKVNELKGRGVFATAYIPEGTITYVKDDLEIEIPEGDKRIDDPILKDVIKTYSYIDQKGRRIISWDDAKYVNHCCQCNTISTGYGFEIAIRDIKAGEEMTDEYGMFNFDYELELICSKSDCRGTVCGNDLDIYYEKWDQKVEAALKHYRQVEQPLENLLNPTIRKKLEKYLETGEGYLSVLELKK